MLKPNPNFRRYHARCGARLRGDPPGQFSHRAQPRHRRAAGKNLSADQRSAPLARVVALREKRPGDATHALRPACGRRCGLPWKGNKEVGEGRMEIIETTPPALIRIQLDFIAPFKAHNIAEFSLQPQGATTRVTWAISGPSPFISKLIGVFMNMDTMIGGDFETGLARLKTLAES